MKQASSILVLWLILGVPGPAAAQSPPASPAAGAGPAQQTLAVPAPEVLLILVRTSLIALNQAVLTGNFTVLRDLGSPAFQAENTAARLGVVFADLRTKNIDLYPVAVVTPQVTETPTVGPDNVLRITGYFPTQPLQVNFQVHFQPAGGQWRLSGLTVNAAPAAAAAVAQDKTEGPDKSAKTDAGPDSKDAKAKKTP